MKDKINVVVWNEFVHEQENEAVRAHYPQGIHEVIAAFLRTDADLAVSTATLHEPEHGLTQERLDACDVLLWWGHGAHSLVSDEVVDRVHRRVHQGMGLIVLHSGHESKVFQSLMGSSCSLFWREDEEIERVWVIEPSHPITQGLGTHFEIPYEEMYGERFEVPAPDELVLVSWFEGGEVFRSGCVWNRGQGRVFYFRPGHEAYPTYHQKEVQLVIRNAVRYVRPRVHVSVRSTHVPQPLSPVSPKAVHFGKAGILPH